MSSLSIIGFLRRKSNVQNVSEKFSKQDFVLETAERYAQIIKFELHNERVGLLDNIEVGAKVEVSFNLRGREWQKDSTSEPQVFNTLAAWRVQVVQSSNTATTTQQPPQNVATPPQTIPTNTPITNTPPQNKQQGGDDDLPF